MGNFVESDELDVDELVVKEGVEKIEHYRKLIEEDPSDIDALTDLGKAYIQIRKFNRALEHLNTALDIVTSEQEGKNISKKLKIHNALAVAYIQQRDYSKAQKLLDQALNLDGTNKDVLNNLGILYVRTGEIKQAIDCFLKILDLDDRDILTWQNLAEFYRLLGEYDESLRCQMRVMELSDE